MTNRGVDFSISTPDGASTDPNPSSTTTPDQAGNNIKVSDDISQTLSSFKQKACENQMALEEKSRLDKLISEFSDDEETHRKRVTETQRKAYYDVSKNISKFLVNFEIMYLL